MLKNTSGLKSEIEHSIKFHQAGIPLLISAQILRSRNLGQIDLSRIRKHQGEWLIEIAEVKASEKGILMMSRGQRLRLSHTLKFLTGVFGHKGKQLNLSQ